MALTLTAADDSDAAAEMLTFTLGTGTGYTVATATATITIDPIVPTVEFSEATLSVAENVDSGVVDVTIQLSEAATGDIAIPLVTMDVSATAGEDYVAFNNSLTFSSGSMSSTISIIITDDDMFEEDETFTVSFGTLPDGVTAGTQTSVTVTIVSEDLPPPALSVAASPTTITEGTASTITITASTAPADDLTIAYTIAGPGIATSDYTLTDASDTELTGLTGNITLAGSATEVTLTLTAADDSDASAEMLTFTLDTPSGTDYTLTTATATITINPAAALSVAASPTTITEGAASTITITASPAPSGNLTIPYTDRRYGH